MLQVVVPVQAPPQFAGQMHIALPGSHAFGAVHVLLHGSPPGSGLASFQKR
jgi:hypothetical protein